MRFTAIRFRRLCTKSLLILAGSMLQGYAMAVFLFPHAIPSGGGAGLAVLLNYGFQIPLSIGLWITNFSFLLLAIKYLGGISAFGTLGVITVTSMSVKVFEVLFHSPFHNVWIDLLVGSVLLGTGISVLYGQGVSNGGIGFVSLAIAKYRGTNPGKSLFWMNGLIFLITAYVIDWAIIIQALICQWLSTRIVSWLHEFPLRRLYPSFLPAQGWRKK
ncbi:membrane protein [Paenibacillus sp. CAA11]|uniref:YitT family protein n=1 Tax=Paenibacillus sp. CAA11 TaxID=1532905 RepID=UPI000D3894CA|nr:YitT family protein [Paenibacillus sp. CAA11]AWB46740.1 membrane protein [Paenibacillus sp. CAA11]